VVVYPQSLDERTAVVRDRNGAAVGSRCLWSAPGEPLEVWFDARAAGGAPSVWLGKHVTTAPWEPEAGLVLEIRSRPDGPFDTAAQIIELWQHAAQVQGRSWSERIFQGANPHGPSVDLIARFTGSFIAPSTGAYDLATISDDGSVLLVDGKQVADWPGGHGPEGGQHAEHHGIVNLTAGRHRIDYTVVQGVGGFTAVVAWKPPGAQDWQPMPATAFAGTASWTAIKPETPNGPDPAAVRWDNTAHAALATEGLDPSMCLMRVQTSGPAKHVAWRFTDGEAAEGSDVMHWWLAPGLRQVAVEFQPESGPTLQRVVPVAVHPDWLQSEQFPGEHPHAWRKVLTSRAFAAAPPGEVAAALRLALAADEAPLITHIADEVPKPTAAVVAVDPELALRAALRLQDAEVRRYRDAATWLQAVVDAPGIPADCTARARLHLGGLRLHVDGDAEQALAAWQGLAADALGAGDRRLLALYRADAVLLSGDTAAAQTAYRAIGTVVDPADRNYVVRRRLRLELARDRISQGNWDEAETLLREIEWETPLERLGQETGPLLMRIWLARGELARARVRGRMLTAGDDGPRTPDILLLAARVELAGNDRAAASRLITRLRTDHPFSEAAAAAHDLLPASATPTKAKP
jgi:hypothetical protein